MVPLNPTPVWCSGDESQTGRDEGWECAWGGSPTSDTTPPPPHIYIKHLYINMSQYKSEIVLYHRIENQYLTMQRRIN